VLQGLHANDWIVLNPADSLDEGMQVNVKEVRQEAAPNANAPNNGTAAPSGNVPPAHDGPARQGDKK
jgi:hypothetical protein